MEQLLFKTASGSGFRKVYYDPTHDRPESIFIPAEDFVVPTARHLSSSTRHTHVMRKSDNFVRKMQVNGFYRDIDLDEATGDEGEVQTKYNQLTGVTKSLIPVSEQSLRSSELDLEVLRMRRRWRTYGSTSLRRHHRLPVQYRPWNTTQCRGRPTKTPSSALRSLPVPARSWLLRLRPHPSYWFDCQILDLNPAPVD